MIYSQPLSKKRILRILCLVIILALVLDLSLYFLIRPADPCTLIQQIPDSTMEECINSLHFRDLYPLVVFIGDSTLEGSRSKFNLTIPRYFASYMGLNTLNFALGGSNIHESSLLASKLSKEADVIFIGLKHTSFARDSSNPVRNAFLNNIGSSSVEQFVKNNVLQNWALYKYRGYLAYELFGKHPREYLVGKYELLEYLYVSGFNYSDAVYKKDTLFYSPFSFFTLQQQKSLTESFRLDDAKVGIIADDYPGLQYVFEIAETADAHEDNKYIIYMTPYSFSIVQDGDLINWTSYYQNVELFRRILNKPNILFLDLNNNTLIRSIPENYYHDMLHPLPPANRIIARILYNETYDFLEDLKSDN